MESLCMNYIYEVAKIEVCIVYNGISLDTRSIVAGTYLQGRHKGIPPNEKFCLASPQWNH